MHIEIFSSLSELGDLESKWLELLQHSLTSTVFQTPQFMQAWWQVFGCAAQNSKLQILVARDDTGELKGIAPLYSRTLPNRQQQLQFIGGAEVADYLDFIVDAEAAEEVYQSLAVFLQQQSEWQNMKLISLPERSLTRTVFGQFFSANGFSVQESQQDVCPVISLPKTWDEYLLSLGKKQRHEVKRKWEKLFRELPAEFELVDESDQLDRAMKDFIQLHQASSQQKKEFWTDQQVAFFMELAKQTAGQKWLKLYFLKIDGRRVAAMLGFAYHNQFYLYNSGFDADEYRAYSVGNVLTSYTIQQAILQGNSRYDFLRGNEEYKFRYGAVAESTFDVEIRR